ncbi:MAG TPA: hypothetical protein VF544_05880 [Pyrinomonadaceae bacterium]|jgi:hypothetical protein
MMRRLMLIVAVLNTVGLVCFYTTAHAHSPLSSQHSSIADSVSVLDSLGFTLMLPGIFFGSVAFLCARALTADEEVARAVWYATAFVINLVIAWKAGHAFAAARM